MYQRGAMQNLASRAFRDRTCSACKKEAGKLFCARIAAKRSAPPAIRAFRLGPRFFEGEITVDKIHAHFAKSRRALAMS